MLRSPSRVSQSSREGWNIIEKVTDYTHAVGRIGSRGSCLLISLPNSANTNGSGHVEHMGMLLTTSFVLNSRAACAGESVTFFESPVTGTHAKWNVSPVTVPLRAENAFHCSVKEEEAKLKAALPSKEDGDGQDLITEELGYTVVACNLRSDRNATIDITRVNPLPLPLILSKIPAVQKGDKHLFITHQNSQQRRYIIVDVVEVHSHHCVYAQPDPDSLFSSGGPIFTDKGEFVGVQHQCGDSSFGIFVRDIVQHLFDSAMLGLCKVPVYDEDAADGGGGIEKGNPNAKITNEEFNKEFNVMARQKLIDVGAGDQIVDFYVLERERAKKATGNAPPETLVPRDHVEVWKEWFKPSDYRSLVLMLHAFPYQPKLAMMIVTEITSHANRLSIINLASLGGIGILLETLDSHAYDEPLVQATIASLARISLYEANREAIVRSDGIAAVISVMKEYSLNYGIQEWATYCLLNLCVDSSSGDQMPESIEGLARYGGLDTVIANLSQHPKGRYLQRWSAQLLGTVAVYSQSFFMMLLDRQLLPRLDDRLIQYEEDGFVLCGLMSFLKNILKASLTKIKDGAEAAAAAAALAEERRRKNIADTHDSSIVSFEELMKPIKFWTDRNILDRLVGSITLHCGKNDDALLFEHLISALGYLFEADGKQIERAIDPLCLESLVAKVTLQFMTEIALHRAALKLLKLLGVSHPVERYPHLQNK